MLGSTYATRNPSAFATLLADVARIPESETLSATTRALSEHEEVHLAFEYLSELSMRARVLKALLPKIDERYYDHILLELCTVADSTQPRLKGVLSRAGIGAHFYWEDIVTRTMQNSM